MDLGTDRDFEDTAWDSASSGKEEMGWKRSHNPVGTRQAEFFLIYRFVSLFFFHVMLFGGIMQPLSCPSTVRLWMNKLFELSRGLQKRLLENILGTEVGTAQLPRPALAPFVLPKISKNSAAINFSSPHLLAMASLNPNHLVFTQAGAWPSLGLNFPKGAARMGAVGELHGWVEGEEDTWARGVHVLEPTT